MNALKALERAPGTYDRAFAAIVRSEPELWGLRPSRLARARSFVWRNRGVISFPFVAPAVALAAYYVTQLIVLAHQ